jgi:hypothetical protein
MTYRLSVRLIANEVFTSEEKARDFAHKWLDRLADRDEPYTWDSCDWQILGEAGE